MQIDTFKVKSFPAIDQIGLSSGTQKLRVCIVTEEIIGPVRNGGIASTYYHLSKGLAAHGHEVHVLFLKGRVVQDETPEHWVEHFAAFGVTLHYLEAPNTPLWGASIEWQARFGAAYEWLRDADPFDVVHTSEWRGGMIYALMAKRMGLAFQETLFLVKTSSPHIWNRHYQMQPIEQRELVLAAYAEQKCVELADAVIGGSAHLITFMEDIGYKVPASNVFVQPNIVDFSKVIVTDERPPRAPGDVVKTQELIFFGRLEARKGVEMMCNALDILKERGIVPEKVTFMGKWGAPLATQGGMRVQDYIAEKSLNWDFPIGIIDDKNQPEALSHMCSRDMIAVMPSLIENSTMAVYETLENNIPFIATAVGGTPELIAEGDHDRCLVAPRAQDLADQLERVLRDGQTIAHSSFSNDENLRVWYGFHAHVGEKVRDLGRATAIGAITKDMNPPPQAVDGISFGVLVRRGDNVSALANALLLETPDEVLIAFTEASLREEVQAAGEVLSKAGLKVRILDAIGQAAGDALNAIADAQTKDAMVLSHGADICPLPGYFEAARTALTHQPDILFTSFFDAGQGILGMPIGGDVASQYLNARAYGPEAFAMRTGTRTRLGRFEPYDVRAGILHEYVTRQVERGGSDMLVHPETLLRWLNGPAKAKGHADDTVYSYLKAKPLIDVSSLAQRKITLATLQQGSAGSLTPTMLRDGGRIDGETLWMMPVDWDRVDIETTRKRAMVIALDETQNRLYLFARGNGERVLHVRGAPVETALMESHEGVGKAKDLVTVSCFDVPPDWDVGASYPMHWILEEDGERTRNQFLRVTKISEGVFALVSRTPILTAPALEALKNQHLAVAPPTAPAPDPAPEHTSVEEVAPPAPEPEPSVAARDAQSPPIETLIDLSHNASRRDFLSRDAHQKSQTLIAALMDKAPRKGTPRGRVMPPMDDAWQIHQNIKGWAWDRDNELEIIHVAVLMDDLPIFMTRADVLMPGLAKGTAGLERHGFSIPILDEFLQSTSVLELMIWETQTMLQNGRIISAKNAQGQNVLQLAEGKRP